MNLYPALKKCDKYKDSNLRVLLLASWEVLRRTESRTIAEKLEARLESGRTASLLETRYS